MVNEPYIGSGPFEPSIGGDFHCRVIAIFNHTWEKAGVYEFSVKVNISLSSRAADDDGYPSLKRDVLDDAIMNGRCPNARTRLVAFL